VKLFPWHEIRRDRVPRPPHVEVEVRFRLDDSANALRQLHARGVRFGKPVLQDDQAYGPEGWDYHQSRIGVTFARLRTSEGKHLFTVKRPLTDVQTCIEHECFVSDRHAMHEAIGLMGFRPTTRIVKRRALAQKGLDTFCLDDVVGLGLFLEVERLAASDDDTDAARVEIEAFVSGAGLLATRCVDTYDGLLRARDADSDSIWQPERVVAAA
jgi:adenylate cyclase class 2